MKTLLSIFEDAGSARAARDRLESSGISDHHLHVEEGTASRGSNASSTHADDIVHATSTGEVVVDRAVLPSIGHVIASIFGLDHQHAHATTYADAVNKGKSVLIADISNESHVDLAHQVLREHGADAGSTTVMPRVSEATLKDLVTRRHYDDMSH